MQNILAGNLYLGIPMALPGHFGGYITVHVLESRYVPAIPGPVGARVSNEWCIRHIHRYSGKTDALSDNILTRIIF